MAKKMTKKESQGIFALLVIGGIIWLATKFTELVGGVNNIIGIGVAIFFIFIVYKILSSISTKREISAKRKRLMEKYNNEEVVNNIMNNSVWVGQSAEQVVDSLGRAVDIDEKVLKTKRKEIWKYGHEGGNRYRLRITLENDVVVGWDNK